MTWAAPGWLVLLALLPLLLVRRRRDAQISALPYPHLDLLPAAPAAGRWRGWIGPGGRLLVLVLLTLALAQPRWPDQDSRLPRQALALGLVLDISGSMAESDFLAADQPPRTRLSAAKELLYQVLKGNGYLPGRSEDLVALVTFAAQVEDICPATSSHAGLVQLIEQAEAIGDIPDNTTNIGDALAVATEMVMRAGSPGRCLILVSDGEHNVRPEVVPNALRPRQAARIAAGVGIRIHTVMITGSASAATPELQRQQEQATQALRDVADLTGGLALRAEEESTLPNLLAALAAQEATVETPTRFAHQEELYPNLALAALCLLVLTVVLETLLDRRLP